MPQARLPDINTAFIVYRREAISSWKSEKYDSCLGSLQTLNGLLPEDYRVQISDDDYNSQVHKEMQLVCTKCDVKSEQHLVKIRKVLLPQLTKFISNNEEEEIWDCPKCGTEHRITQTLILKPELQEPYFLGIVPSPPVRREGMKDRTRFHIDFSRWFWLCLSEIEKKMADFRDDNWHKAGELEDFEEQIEDSGESED